MTNPINFFHTETAGGHSWQKHRPLFYDSTVPGVPANIEANIGRMREGITEDENNIYVVLKWNIPGLAGE